MTHQGAVLQGYNNELVKYLENLCMQREGLDEQIRQTEKEKKMIQDEIEILTKQLDCVCESLSWKHAAQKDLDKTLAETEVVYEKILESSRTLLSVLKTEKRNLDKILAISDSTVDFQVSGLQKTQH